MPVTLNVGYSRMIGEPNYGSRGASVTLQIEDSSARLSLRSCTLAIRTSGGGCLFNGKQRMEDCDAYVDCAHQAKADILHPMEYAGCAAGATCWWLKRNWC